MRTKEPHEDYVIMCMKCLAQVMAHGKHLINAKSAFIKWSLSLSLFLLD
jgi:hypothetical protein